MPAMTANHPKDIYNCLCKECVWASWVRMGLTRGTPAMTKKQWMAHDDD